MSVFETGLNVFNANFSSLNALKGKDGAKLGEAHIGLHKNGDLVVYTGIDFLLHPNQVRQAKDFLAENMGCDTAEKSFPLLADLLVQARRRDVSASFVAADIHAGDKFKNDPRFNHVVNTCTPAEAERFDSDKRQVLDGCIRPLQGCGIVAPSSLLDTLPVKFDFIMHDKNVNMTGGSEFPLRNEGRPKGFYVYDGAHAKADEQLPGTPYGNYFNKHAFGSDLKIIGVDNGDKGTLGIRINFDDIPENIPLLINGGALSGCTMVYGVKDGHFYAYHAGKATREDDGWTTCTDGARSIMETHAQFAGGQAPAGVFGNQALLDFLQGSFDYAVMGYCGHDDRPDSIVKNNGSRVVSFNYNGRDAGGAVRVGNSAALLMKKDGVLSFETLNDDMSIGLQSGDIQSLDCRTTRWVSGR
ncbi:hypothetical protein K5M36_11955 [Chromobacterium vaccinii]|nr:hypothetical protein [Chromobacterium vaccinii]